MNHVDKMGVANKLNNKIKFKKIIITLIITDDVAVASIEVKEGGREKGGNKDINIYNCVNN